MNEENENNITRRDFLVLTTISMAAVGIGSFLWPAIDSLNPSADVLAVSSIEVDLTPIQVGQSITVKWRGKPIFIRNRTQQEIDEARSVNLNQLIDPQLDKDRVKQGKDQWLVLIGICTHLGCVPLGKQGEYDGWLCPCHGSEYDSSGRVRRGPAPKNLAVPEYIFLTDNRIKIG